MVRGVTISPSAGTIAGYFTALGQKQISNAVDISNFVLLGMGHPNHVFDLDKIEGGIIVRYAQAGEQIKLLDGTTRTLVGTDLVIADERKALSLAGVMGGFDSMITAETKNILIEAAWFDPATIRATSRRHLIHTDASHRYERGADFAAPPDSLGPGRARAARSLRRHARRVAGGRYHSRRGREDHQSPEYPALDLRGASAAGHDPGSGGHYQRPGRAVSRRAWLHAYLREWPARGTSSWPSWRLDLTREIDLIEEIARVYGYNRFANTLPTPAEVIPHATARAGECCSCTALHAGFLRGDLQHFCERRGNPALSHLRRLPSRSKIP